QEPDRRADQEREREALAHPHQRIERETADALIHLAILEERLEHVPPRLRPRARRRRQIVGDGLADHRPQHEHDGQPEAGEHDPLDDGGTHAAIVWTAKPFAYFSGSPAGSNTPPSKNVSFCASPRGL